MLCPKSDLCFADLIPRCRNAILCSNSLDCPRMTDRKNLRSRRVPETVWAPRNVKGAIVSPEARVPGPRYRLPRSAFDSPSA